MKHYLKLYVSNEIGSYSSLKGHHVNLQWFRAAVPTFFGTRNWIHGRLSTDRGDGDGFEMIHAHYIYRALGFCYYYISSDHQALDPRGWAPLD